MSATTLVASDAVTPRGLPLLPLSSKPSRPFSIYRLRHIPTICADTPRWRATATSVLPSAHANTPSARLFTDAEATYTYEGTNEINLLVAGRELTGIGAFV